MARAPDKPTVTYRSIREWVESNPLRLWRHSQKHVVTAMDCAIRLGCSGPSVQNWEFGQTNPKPKFIVRIAELIGTDQLTLETLWTKWRNSQPKS